MAVRYLSVYSACIYSGFNKFKCFSVIFFLSSSLWSVSLPTKSSAIKEFVQYIEVLDTSASLSEIVDVISDFRKELALQHEDVPLLSELLLYIGDFIQDLGVESDSKEFISLYNMLTSKEAELITSKLHDEALDWLQNSQNPII